AVAARLRNRRPARPYNAGSYVAQAACADKGKDEGPMSRHDSIVIAGGAFAGLALALALRQGLGPQAQVVVADPALATRSGYDPRASAIVAACRRLFEALGVWGEVAADAQPILDMVVTDSRLEDVSRPSFLTFVGEVEP